MTIYCIVPFSKQTFEQNAWYNFDQQLYQDKKLIVVQNCEARWTKKADEIILESENGVSQPMNKGLEWIRRHGNKNDWFCKFDVDDRYLPKYLNTIEEGIKKGADIIGRNTCWVKNCENKLWFIEGVAECWCNGQYCHGPTLAGRVDISPDFPIVAKFGEDEKWWELTVKNKQWIGPSHSFVYCRYYNGDHSYPFSDDSFKDIYTGRLYECIKGSPENNYPTEMKIIQKQLYSEDFDRMIKEITGNK